MSEPRKRKPVAEKQQPQGVVARKRPWDEADFAEEIKKLQDRIGRFKAIDRKMKVAKLPTIEIDGDAGLARGYKFIDEFLARAESSLTLAEAKRQMEAAMAMRRRNK